MRTFACLALFCTIAGCDLTFGESYELDGSTFDAEALKTVETNAGIVLPADSRGLNMVYQGDTIDPSFIAKIQIPADGVDALAEQITQFEHDSVEVMSGITSHRPWWDVDALDVRVHRKVDGIDYVELILGEADGKWFLLVMWVTF